MVRANLFLVLAIAVRLASESAAALTVNPARPITHQVSIQVIQTALNNGTSPAPLWGDPTREAAIKAAVDTIWAQAGIDIQFLPNVVRYNNTFAHQGLGVGIRPITDLNAIIVNAGLQGGILHSNPSVINMFFVNVVPGFDAKPANWANGVGNIGLNGIAMYIGSGVSAEHAGHWIAHEIGHNLGLLHAPTGSTNLMTSSRNTELLSTQQVSAVFANDWDDAVASIPLGGTSFPRPLFTQPGDYNRNGIVDASDYALWRKTLNSTTDLAADGNGNGRIDQGDLTVWRSNFGRGFASQLILPGDYNLNGEVEASDYALWRESLGSTVNLAADGDGNGVVDDGDYALWRSNFGRGVASASFEAGGEPQFAGEVGSPEPGAGVMMLVALVFALLSRIRPANLSPRWASAAN